MLLYFHRSNKIFLELVIEFLSTVDLFFREIKRNIGKNCYFYRVTKLIREFILMRLHKININIHFNWVILFVTFVIINRGWCKKPNKTDFTEKSPKKLLFIKNLQFARFSKVKKGVFSLSYWKKNILKSKHFLLISAEVFAIFSVKTVSFGFFAPPSRPNWAENILLPGPGRFTYNIATGNSCGVTGCNSDNENLTPSKFLFHLAHPVQYRTGTPARQKIFCPHRSSMTKVVFI